MNGRRMHLQAMPLFTWYAKSIYRDAAKSFEVPDAL
jgi:hypothetical protein